MPSGTIINNIFAPRLHKSNADEKLKEARKTREESIRAILFLVGANGNQADVCNSISIVSDLLSDFSEATWTMHMARVIVDYPEDCVDELDPIV